MLTMDCVEVEMGIARHKCRLEGSDVHPYLSKDRIHLE